MPNIPCPDKIDCQCADGSPFRNLSSEAPDVRTFLSVGFAAIIPPLGFEWDVASCRGVCRSTVSQQAADLCAAQAADTCIFTALSPPGPSGGSAPSLPPVPPPQGPQGQGRVPIFSNTPQSCAAVCADGLPFNYQVPADIFSALSQAAADAMAQSYACRLALLHRICLSALATARVCVHSNYFATITATGAFLGVDNWQIVAGGLPPGLTFNGGVVSGGVVTITGTPTSTGVYDFTVQITAPNGDTMQKPYEIVVAGFTNLAGLPAGIVGTPYSYQLVSVGITGPVFSLAPGSDALPDGLSLSASGLISGTPETEQTQTSTFVATETP